MIKTEEKPMTVRELQLTHVIEQQNEIMERLCNDGKEITERFDHVMEENKRLHEEIEMLRSDNETQCRTLAQMHDEAELVQMFRVLEGYVRDDVDLMNIGRAVVSYVDLLDRKAVERNV